ncbi:MAG: hypothetical protein DLM73_17430 [Chthoniobacterales bacterium]|nr:MAG: hypothetical protein DLM73_17430 [Chthoniobacterales bacterium]
MKALTILAVVFGWSTSLTVAAFAAEKDSEESGQDSSAGLPAAYAKHYLVAGKTMSPDKKFAVIYPTLDFSESPEAKDILVVLKPFSVLAPLPTKWPYFQNESHGGISADWSTDSTVALITLDSKWGPGDVFVVELAEGKVKRITNVLEKLRELLLPQFRSAKPKPERYNDAGEFIFEDEENSACTLEGTKLVKIDTKATNDPKGMSKRGWAVQVKAEWDIAQAKFISQKITLAPRQSSGD